MVSCDRIASSVWVAGILGDPTHVPCKNCGTKVGPVTGHCRRHAQQGCQTIHEVESPILATVTLADHTGELDRVLVDGGRLQLLANVKSKAELLTLLMRRCPQAVCFRRPADVRLATTGRKPGGGKSNVPVATQGVLQSQETESASVALPLHLRIYTPSPLYIYIVARSHPQIYLFTSTHPHICASLSHLRIHTVTPLFLSFYISFLSIF